jgi:hypothetical protein
VILGAGFHADRHGLGMQEGQESISKSPHAEVTPSVLMQVQNKIIF